MEQDGREELVIARSLDDGQTLWKYALKTRWDDFMSGVGPRSTPTLSDGKLYALYSDGSLVCLDAGSGKPLWETKTVGINHEFPEWGISCSPLIWKDLVIVTPGGDQGAVQAFQAGLGKPVWKSALHGEGVYLSPSALTLLDTEQLITAVSGKIASWIRPPEISFGNIPGKSFSTTPKSYNLSLCP